VDGSVVLFLIASNVCAVHNDDFLEYLGIFGIFGILRDILGFFGDFLRSRRYGATKQPYFFKDLFGI